MRQLMSGNEALAQGALQAGCRFYAGYPITPQNELIAYMAAHMQPCGGVFIQAESELAAINMVFGASATGVRAMTSSSSPGISLKQEGISYLAGAELPAVIVNVMRGGPGLGNIAPAQSDYFQATRGGGHGDYHCPVLAPFCVQESFELMRDAFDLADTYRTPVMVLSDGMLGQMMEPVAGVSAGACAQGKPQGAKPWALTGCHGRAPNIVRSFRLAEGALEELNLALQEKYARIRAKEQRAQETGVDDASVILIAYGSMARVAKAIVRECRQEGKKVGLLRPITLWPFPDKALKRIARGGGKKKKFLVVEMSYGQMVEDVRLALAGASEVAFLGRGGGGIPSEEAIVRAVKRLLKK